MEKLNVEAEDLIPAVEYGDWNVEVSMLILPEEKLALWDWGMPPPPPPFW